MSVSPRSLADDLRGRSDAQILSLLADRGDLTHPIPPSISDLARSANTSGSISSALDQLSATDLTVLEASCALVPDHKLTVKLLEDSLHSGPPQIVESVSKLWRLALLWGPENDLRVPSAVRESMGPQPCGIDQVIRSRDPKAATLSIATIENESAFADAPFGTRELLHELTWQNPIMATHDGTMSAPASWLHSHRLLIAAGESALALPREISLALRHGRLLPGPMPAEPALDGHPWPQSQSFSTAAHAADLFIRVVDRVVGSLRANPLAIRNRGGLVARDWRTRADELHLSDSNLARAIEIASAAGWLRDNGAERLVPTIQFSQNVDAPREDRWTDLAMAWLTMPRQPWFDSSGADDLPTCTPLSPDMTDEQMPLTKADMLLALVQAESSASTAVMLSWLEWRRPRSKPSALVVGELMAQAEILGITGLGTISPFGAALSTQEHMPRVRAALGSLLPETSDRLLLQADLTATAPSPLTAKTERRLARAAEFVSGGGATVYRFTHESLASGLAHGEHATALLEWLKEISATDLPRALPVLVDDVARAQGDVRVSSAAAALSGDPDTMSELMSNPALAGAGLSQLSATTLTTSVAPTELMSMLRSAGVRVHESPETATPAEGERDRTARESTAWDDTGLRTRVVKALRVIEAGATASHNPLVSSSSPIPPEEHLPLGAARSTQTLREATESGTEAWLEFSDASGSVQTHLIMPIDVSGGTATVLNRSQNAIQSISLSRILGVTPARELEQDHTP